MSLLTPPTRAAPRPSHPSAVLDGIVSAWGSLRAIALMRLVFGIIVIRHVWPDLRASVLPVERFHVPWWSWLPVPSPSVYRGLVWLGVAAGIAMVLGLAPRLATRIAFVVVTYLVFLDMTSFAHNRGFLVWMLFGLALLPTDGAFSVSSAHKHQAFGPLWPVLLLRIVVSTVYLTSGLTKLLNPDWVSGLVLWDRVVRHEHLIPFDGWIHDVLTARLFHHLLSPAAIAVELFVGVGLWLRRTRLTAIWIALVFHVSIELAASVQTFSYSAIAALLIWVTPRVGDRVLTATPGAKRLVARLDWLQRFQLDPQPVVERERTQLTDRDGSVRHGRDAQLTALSRLPLLFPIVAPALAWHRLRSTSG